MKVDWKTFSERYCLTQTATPDDLAEALRQKIVRFEPEGFMLAEVQYVVSSWFGSVVVIPYGPRNSFKEPPDHPFSPRGWTPDISVVIMTLDVCDVPAECPEEVT